jgi:circadian clock protein KaiC
MPDAAMRTQAMMNKRWGGKPDHGWGHVFPSCRAGTSASLRWVYSQILLVVKVGGGDLDGGWSELNQRPTGVPGLDLLLGGGLLPGAVVVVAGVPGAGKTILAQQMCFAAATAERKCVYYTTVSESHTKLVAHMEDFSFFDPAALGARVEYIHLGDFLRPARREGLESLVAEIVRKVLEEEPAIVVVDSAKMLRDFADDRELRGSLYDLTTRIAGTGTMLLLVGEYTTAELRSGIEFSLADGILQLEYEAREPIDRRWLRIAKMRGANPRSGKHTFRIGPGGIEVFPRIETLEPLDPMLVSGRFPSGIPGLDDLMSGGAQQGDATMVNGPSGVGKTIFGLSWLLQGAKLGQRCMYVTFQDTAGQLRRAAEGFGLDVKSAEAAGLVTITHVPLGELDLDALATSMRARLATHAVGRIVIDSLSELAFAARESERFPAYMRSLVGVIRAAGTSSLVTSETGARSFPGSALDGLLFLFDNIIDLRFIEVGSQIGRSLQVAKMRSSSHKMTLNRFDITDQGLTVGGELEGVTGRLGWSALRTQGASESAVPR